MTKVYQTIQEIQYLYWRGYYWLATKQIKHDCGRLLTIYRKFRMWKGELQEVKQGNRICSTCQVGY